MVRKLRKTNLSSINEKRNQFFSRFLNFILHRRGLPLHPRGTLRLRWLPLDTAGTQKPDLKEKFHIQNL